MTTPHPCYVYGKVIREGLAEDLRFYIDVDWLIKLWPRIGAPRTHTEAWIDWVRRHRGIELPNRFVELPNRFTDPVSATAGGAQLAAGTQSRCWRPTSPPPKGSPWLVQR